MLKAALAAIVVFSVLLSVKPVFTQEDEAMGQEVIIEGIVESLSTDDGILIIDDKRIFLPEGERDDWYLEKGDSVKIVAKETDAGLVGVDYDFIWEEEPYEEEEFDSELDEEYTE